MIETTLLSKTMNYVLQALNNVPEQYYTQPKAKLVHGKLIVSEDITNSESTFSHQLQPSIELLFTRNSFHIDKQFETEISKQIIFSNDEKLATYGPTFNQLYGKDDSEDQEFYAIPDIVIHAGNDDFQKKNQLFIAELKTNRNLSSGSFNIDLFKTALYHNDFLFSYSAFVIVNVPVTKVRKMFQSYVEQGYFLPTRKGMYIIVKSDFESAARVFLIN